MTHSTALVEKSGSDTIHGCTVALENHEISSVVLCEKFIDRYHQIDSNVRGFLNLNEDTILTHAKESDKRRRSGQQLSRYDGVPIAIKDNISVRGQPCSCASQILKGYTAPYDATVIAKLKAAGFICFGRTNMDEFAMGSSTENSSYFPTCNPWDLTTVPGGSSGGSAAVVASGQVPASLGSDTGGSIRQPASFCGVVGLKPTYGRVSRYGLVAFASSLDQIGPITHDVRDAAILLDVLSGNDPRDSTTLSESDEGLEQSLKATEISTFKIGVPQKLLVDKALSPEVRILTERAISVYRNAGCDVVDIALPHMDYALASYYIIATAEASSNLARFDGIRYGNRKCDDGSDLLNTYLKTREYGFGMEVKRRILLGTYVLSSGYYDAYYLKAQKMRTLIRKDFDDAFKLCDIMITPVTPTPAFKLGSVTDPLQMYLSDIYTIPANLSGVCAISIPAGVSSQGHPVGLQLTGASMCERNILQAGHWFLHQQRKESDV